MKKLVFYITLVLSFSAYGCLLENSYTCHNQFIAKDLKVNSVLTSIDQDFLIIKLEGVKVNTGWDGSLSFGKSISRTKKFKIGKTTIDRANRSTRTNTTYLTLNGKCVGEEFRYNEFESNYSGNRISNGYSREENLILGSEKFSYKNDENFIINCTAQ